MKIAIVGSRNYKHLERVGVTMGMSFGICEDIEFISGGASGVDTEAAMFCKENDIPFREFKPNMSAGYDVKEYHLRNDRIIAEADQVIAFWDGESKGTESVILKCLQRRKNVQVIFD